ncbi:MAG: glycosyl hydrolase [Phycisphaerales bacterium]|nr:glycosyl hydrolase [Phycisphaerales bacterium]
MRPLTMCFGCLITTFAATTTRGAIPVGSGSYQAAIPAAQRGPSDTSGEAVTPRLTDGFAGPPPTNSWWSSLIWERHPGNVYGQPIHAHPLSMQAATEGLYLGHVVSPSVWDRGYEYSFSGGTAALTLGMDGMAASEVQVAGSGDWTVVAQWDDGVRTMRTTIGRGLPIVLAECQGGDPIVYCGGGTIHFQSSQAVVLEKNGQYWGAFAPTGFTWTQEGDLWRCSGAPAVSVGILPDGDADTITRFSQSALIAVRDTRVSWTWEPDTRTVRATYDFVTEPLSAGSSDVLCCLYRHQWLHSDVALTGDTYPSARGTMKLAATHSFDVVFPVPAVLPNLPMVDSIDASTAGGYLNESVGDGAASYISDTYWGGKSLGRTSQLALIADATSDLITRDQLVADLKSGLEEWFSADGSAEFAYDSTWGTLIGYPASYGADTELNDHHFHYGYFVWAAAVVARFDPSWAEESAWGGMVELLIRDAANWQRSDERFCFLRHFEPYVCHSYAAGHAGFAAGNNQESSSEAINFATGCLMWGETTGRDDIRDLGLFLLAAESAAVEQYWFDVDEQVFPSGMPRDLAGIVWDAGASYSTWWTANVEEIHGINMLPITGGSLYLGRRADAVSRLWQYFLQENPGEPTVWHDILWSYQALADPAAALNSFLTTSYTPEGGDSKARTYWWLAALNGLGQIDATVGGDAPLSAVFLDDTTRTYAAHNMSAADKEVAFTDGFRMCVVAGETATATNAGPTPRCDSGGDFDGSGSIDVSDLLILLRAWGGCQLSECPTDMTGDSMTDVYDLQAFLAAW